MALAPSPASQTTIMSFWLSMTSLRPSRTTTWSSASRMRSRPLGSGMLACCAEAYRRRRDGRDRNGRHAHKDGRTVAGRRLDLQGGANQRRTFLHAQQTEPAAVAVHSGQVETDAVILDDQRDLIGPPLENDLHVAGARVLGDVVEGLLRDPVERRLDLGGETVGRQAGGMKLY